MNDELPKSWVWTSLGEIASKVTDGTHKTPFYVEGGIPFISVKDIYKDKINFENTKYISCEEHNLLIKRCNPEYGDVVITKSGTIGRTAVVKTSIPFSLFVSVALIKLPQEYISSSFMSLALKNYINSIDIQQSVKGGVIKNFHIEDLKKINIPIPPLAEQQRIVNKIEELFTNLDKGIESLEEVKYKLKIYRQAILKYTMEGKLTEKWREENKDKLINYFQKLDIGQTDGPNDKLIIPKEWKWTKLENIISSISNGITEKQNKEKIGLPVTRIETISDGTINRDRVGYLQNLDNSQIKKYRLMGGDILLSNINSDFHLGKTAVFEIEDQLLLHGMNLLLIRPLKIYVSSKFLNYLFMFYRYSGVFISIAQHAVNQSSINQTKLKNLDIPLPSSEEQHKIVERIEQLFSLADYIEETVDSKLEQSKKLRQSILKKAFEGKLVPQDPNDEPAEILLERIKMENQIKKN